MTGPEWSSGESPKRGAPGSRPDHHAARELERLCADRPIPESELAPVNSFYGHASALRAYAGVATERPVHAIIPHSPTPNPRFVWKGEQEPDVPAVLSYPSYRAAAFERTTRKQVIPSASPYLYVKRMWGSPTASKRSGMIFFPSHSTHHLTAAVDADSLSDHLSRLANRYGPVTVCMYWRDVQLDRHIPLQDRGFEVVSAGHMFDPGFLPRLHELCSRHVYASGSTFGSHVMFSVMSGCTYVPPEAPPIPPTPLEVVRPTVEKNAVRVPDEAVDLGQVPDVRHVFLQPTPDLPAQRQATDYFLGAEHALSPRELRTLLDRLARLDRRQVVVSRSDGSRVAVVPPALRRTVSHVRRLIERLP